LLLGIDGHFFRCLLGESIEDIDIGHYITMTLSETKKFLLLDVYNALGHMEGAKCHPKLLPREAIIFGP
jgi:hypothetical protein